MSKTVLHINDEAVTLEAVQKKPHELRFEIDGKAYHFRGQRLADGSFLLEEESAPSQWKRLTGASAQGLKGSRRIQVGNVEAKVSLPLGSGAGNAASALAPTAPMPGAIRQVLVKEGDTVKKGQALIVIEAMKLQTTLSAGGDATVEAVLVKPGDLVTEGAELVRLKEKG